MMRFPDVSATHIVFVYGEDLWLVPREGGTATPLASPPGEELLPRFSPDGQSIAFVGNYDGNQDIYTIPTGGGPAQRVTYHPSAELLCDWTADGKLLYSSDCYSGLGRQAGLFVRRADEPLPAQLPVPYGTNGTISPDGTWLAFTPHSHDFRTWKRYRGGMASDIWLFHLQTHESRQITDFEGTDSLPMWHGSAVYYVSDAGHEHRLNIWMFDSKTGERKQVTKFASDDCKWPSIGPGSNSQGEIVVQNAAHLYRVSLPDGAATPVEIVIPGDRPKIRPRTIDAVAWSSNIDISPSAKRIALEARGDIWTIPAKHGSPRNLTRTSGVAERDPAWSADGKWVAYFSDASGEYELMISQSDGAGQTKPLTSNGQYFRYRPIWSPDCKHLYFCDKTGAMFIHSLESGETKQIDRDPASNQLGVSWSHNSQWVAYARSEDSRRATSAIWVYGVADGTKQRLTSGFFNDGEVAFDRKGDFLYFVSNRAFTDPTYEDIGNSFIYSNTGVLMGIPLRSDVKFPLLAKSDEEGLKPKDEKSGDEPKSKDAAGGQQADAAMADVAENGDATKDEPKPDDPPKPFAIEFDGSEARSFRVPVDQGRFDGLFVNDKHQLVYARIDEGGSNDDDEIPDRNASIMLFDFADEKLKEKTVVEGQGNFTSTDDGKKLLVVGRDKKVWIIDAAPDQKLEDPISLGGLYVTVDPRAEWAQVLNEAWRIERDFFYDPNMHGVDWKGIGDHYSAMLPDCVSRRDVSFLIREMISELNVGHAYYREGDVEQAPQASTGLPGCRFELADGAFRIAELFQGSPWDVDARNPLVQAGVKIGEYVLAVNHVPLDPARDPYAAFGRLADQTVVLTISADAKRDESDRQVPIKLLGSDGELRFRQWIETKRKYVDSKTEGRIGFIYVTNTGVPGQNDLFRQFYGQIDKQALIIDDRWNGGGQIPTRFIELLNRPATNLWALRDGRDWLWPTDSHQGPKCMLINGMAGSGGDMFPLLFRQAKLGKLIGMRTWGGLVGISGNPPLIDGSAVTAPTFAYYELDGTWGVEGHGVDPDLKVVDDPAKMVNGGDPQLDAAIDLMLSELKTNAFQAPKRPAYPDRKGFGIKPEDK
jgi:tricorn protease